MFNKVTWLNGENEAQKFLKSLKYKILETNFKTKFGEIDIIVKDGDTFVFVEVKARASAKFGFPCEAVTPAKQNKIRLLAENYLILKKQFPSLMRFDVVEVLDGKINHILNAF